MSTGKYTIATRAGLGVAVGCALGVIYYLIWRPFGLLWVDDWATLAALRAGAEPSFNSLPSFLLMWICTACAVGLFKGHVKSSVLATGLGLLAALLCEIYLGVFDSLDVLALLLGAGLSLLFLLHHSDHVDRKANIGPAFSAKALLLVSVSVGLSSGSYYTDCEESGRCHPAPEPYPSGKTPVYMSYQDLRNAVQAEPAKPIQSLGRLYLYENYLFINERNQGIHIYDNSDPTAPVAKGFLAIPGNTALSIRDKYLYADSYVDLVTLDLNDPENIQVVQRETDVFPYDPWQNVPRDIRLWGWDKNQGVVVGYE